MCRLLVGLAVDIVGVVSWTDRLQIHVTTSRDRPSCSTCTAPAVGHGIVRRRLVDLPCFDRRTLLVWHQHRWRCPTTSCPVVTWTEQEPSIVAGRLSITDRAGRWACEQVGRHGRSVSEVADDLGCAWHTVNRAVLAYGQPLVEDPDRLVAPRQVGLDELAWLRHGQFRYREWSTQIVGDGVLLDVVRGRDAAAVTGWLAGRDEAWRAAVKVVTLDLSGTYRSVADTALPNAVQVADHFHVIRLCNERLDEVRRRVQNDTLGRRGRRDDPLYRARRLLVMADEHLADDRQARRRGLLKAGDPRGHVADAWTAKEAVREYYALTDPSLADRWLDELVVDLVDHDVPELRRLGRTLRRWQPAIAAFHHTRASNAATEAANNLAKRVKRVAFGIVNWDHWRTRVLLYAGGVDWSKLTGVTPSPT